RPCLVLALDEADAIMVGKSLDDSPGDEGLVRDVTRAAGVASSLSMMPARTRMAVLVWLRATDLISVRVRALGVFCRARGGAGSLTS
ncbi:hypothetical protein ACSTG0_23365, partial [Vibrio parahaemolyticus]